MCNIVCGMCGLMSDTYSDWDEHVTEVTIKEDSDHASLMAVQIKPNGEKVCLMLFKMHEILKYFWNDTKNKKRMKMLNA